jgi:uncharacterized repeat protein (TIGR03803 family)
MSSRWIQVLLLGATILFSASSSLATVDAVFVPGKGEGWAVDGGVIEDRVGNIYGVTRNSSKGIFINNTARGCGSIFRINPAGVQDTLYDFSSHRHSTGCRVYGELLLQDDMLYGVTSAGGFRDNGTIFRLTLSGEHQVLHRFRGKDGRVPGAGLTIAPDGALYGVTTHGGQYDAGTVFRIGKGGRFETLYSFKPNDPRGARPLWPLTVGADGALYGVAYGAGDKIFRVGLDGTVTLERSLEYLDGCSPQALTLGSDGWLYGAAFACGAHGMGTLYRLYPGGKLERLHAFTGEDGSMPKNRLRESSQGDWFGVTLGTAEGTLSTLYRTRFDGSGVEVIHIFGSPVDGYNPSGPVLLRSDGFVYGTCGAGGNEKGLTGSGPGMVFRKEYQ